MHRLLVALNRLGISLDNVNIEETASILQTWLRAAERPGRRLEVQAALICAVWRRRTGRTQQVVLNLDGTAMAMQSVFHQRQWHTRSCPRRRTIPQLICTLPGMAVLS